MTIQNAPPGLDYDRDKRFSKVSCSFWLESMWDISGSRILCTNDNLGLGPLYPFYSIDLQKAVLQLLSCLVSFLWIDD